MLGVAVAFDRPSIVLCLSRRQVTSDVTALFDDRGYYSVIMRGTTDGHDTKPGEMFFVVRAAHPGRDAKILLELATNTYHAYNAWGGSCLYSGPDHARVSFNRPIAIFETPLLPGRDWYNPNTNCAHTWELPFIRWAERAGYKVDLCTNLDLEMHPEMLRHYHLVLSVGHDEYWSAGMRDNLERYITNGGNVAFFSGNTCCWQVRVEDDGRALVCYKRAHDRDPIFKTDELHRLTTLWSDPALARPENQMTGVGFPYGGYNGLFGEFMEGPGTGTYTVHRPDHWVLAGTGLREGDTFGTKAGIAGYECDGCEFVLEGGGLCPPVETARRGILKSWLPRLLAGVLAMGRWVGRLNCGRLYRLRTECPTISRIVRAQRFWAFTAAVGRWSRSVAPIGLMDWRLATRSSSRLCATSSIGYRSEGTNHAASCNLLVLVVDSM